MYQANLSLLETGRATHDRFVADGRAEQARLVA